MTRDEQQNLWTLEASRPRLEVLARFLLEIRRRGARPSQATFSRWWRRKSREVRMDLDALNSLIMSRCFFQIQDALNKRSILYELFL